MTNNETKQKIEKLCKILRHHNHQYYILDAPEISDEVYDSLLQELIKLEKKYPEFDNLAALALEALEIK